MTLTMAWLRVVGNTEELVFASDSRLGGGNRWDCCPKILTLPRSDALISFAGRTEYAYPLALQLARAIELYPASHDRRLDLFDLKGHCVRMFNQMRGLISGLPFGDASPGDPETWFLFGGYSWKHGRFAVWTIHYDASIDAFTFRPTSPWKAQNSGRKLVAFVGDVAPAAKDRLTRLLAERGKLGDGSLDMEPFEVLRDLLRSNQYDSIGGAPQLAKVYRYLQVQQFAVRWPTDEGAPHVMGRPALDYEVFDAPVIHPDRPELHSRVARLGTPRLSPHDPLDSESTPELDQADAAAILGDNDPEA